MAKAKTSLVVTDDAFVMLQFHCGVMLCICTWLLPYFSSLENRDTKKTERVLFPFPFPLLLPLSCFSTNLEPRQYMLHIAGRAWASLVLSLHELTVHYSNKHYASQPM